MKTLAYARVSTDKQDADNQVYELRRFMDSRNIRCDDIITEVVSGTVKLKDRRIGQVIDSLSSGDTLIVSEISRLSRDMLTIARIIQDCLERGITIVAVKEGWTLGNDPGSKFTAVAFGMAAEIERNFISQRTKEGLARRKHEGVKLGRPVGTHKPESRKLHGKDNEIVSLLKARVPKAAIARYFGTTRETARTYIRDNQLEARALGFGDFSPPKTPV